MIKSILIDDEEYFLFAFSKLLKVNFPEISVVGTATNIAEGVEIIRNVKPDLVFLDIEMNNETGFDLFKYFDKIDFEVIFVTSHDECAIKAIKYSAFDFILKPVDNDELKEAIDRWKQKKYSREISNEAIRLLIENTQSKTYKKITFNTSKGIRIVDIDQIIRCQADTCYCLIILNGNEKLLISKNISSIEELLPDKIFIRCHKSHLVNLNYIKEYSYEDGGKIILHDGAKIDVSTRKREFVINFIKQR